MNIVINNISNAWSAVVSAARTTINKDAGSGKEPSTEWKRRMLFSEHSPIRKIAVDWTWEGLKSWISVHFVRHKYGVEHYVSTQRDDRTGIDRNKSPQDTPVNHNAVANATAIINISRKRLCKKAHPETRAAWGEFLQALTVAEPELVSVCVPECVYRNGICPEHQTCGFNFTKEFDAMREAYVAQHKSQVRNIS